MGLIHLCIVSTLELFFFCSTYRTYKGEIIIEENAHRNCHLGIFLFVLFWQRLNDKMIRSYWSSSIGQMIS